MTNSLTKVFAIVVAAPFSPPAIAPGKQGKPNSGAFNYGGGPVPLASRWFELLASRRNGCGAP